MSAAIAALYDIHGNLPALEAVLADVQRERVDRIVVGGDVFPGPLAGEALGRLLSCGIECKFLLGNGDRAVLEAHHGVSSAALPTEVRELMEWHARNMAPGQLRVLRSWRKSVRLKATSLGRVVFVHATPRNDTEIVTERTPSETMQEVFADADADLVVCGHTHMQFDRNVGELRIVNAGSIGMPFERPAGAYWALLGADVELRRTDYDLQAAAEVVRRSSYPAADTFADRFILHPPTREQTLQLYAPDTKR